jgi:membrane protein implicated in regulation of membrane protease activity
MVWWIWILLSILLIAMELLTPGGLFLIFFGVAALAVGALAAAGLAGRSPSVAPLLGLAIGSLLLFRNRLVKLWKTGVALVPSTVWSASSPPRPRRSPGRVGRAGSAAPRTARNAGEASLSPGQRCRVEKVDGLLLYIRAEG